MNDPYFEELAKRNPTKMGRDRDTELPFILSEAQRNVTQRILKWYQHERKLPQGAPPLTRAEAIELEDLIDCFEGAS